MTPPGRGSESSTTRPLRTIESTFQASSVMAAQARLNAWRRQPTGAGGPSARGNESKAPAALGRRLGGVVTPAPTPSAPTPAAAVGRPVGLGCG